VNNNSLKQKIYESVFRELKDRLIKVFSLYDSVGYKNCRSQKLQPLRKV